MIGVINILLPNSECYVFVVRVENLSLLVRYTLQPNKIGFGRSDMSAKVLLRHLLSIIERATKNFNFKEISISKFLPPGFDDSISCARHVHALSPECMRRCGICGIRTAGESNISVIGRVSTSVETPRSWTKSATLEMAEGISICFEHFRTQPEYWQLHGLSGSIGR
jgi:hypothetical protein